METPYAIDRAWVFKPLGDCGNRDADWEISFLIHKLLVTA